MHGGLDFINSKYNLKPKKGVHKSAGSVESVKCSMNYINIALHLMNKLAVSKSRA